MKSAISQIGFGGGCHWCTEAVFQALKGVIKVKQGWIASEGGNENFSEAVLVHFNSEEITIESLIKVHLHTHKCTSNHSMRKKYRSAVYTFSDEQLIQSKILIAGFQNDFENKIITKVLPFIAFKPSSSEFQNYYIKNPSKPFCKRYINPKLKFIMSELIPKLG